jgi:hypothetical protein
MTDNNDYYETVNNDYYEVGCSPQYERQNQVSAQPAGIWKAYGLVRDAEGNPVIDDPDTLPQQIKDLLTDEEYFTIYNEQRK